MDTDEKKNMIMYDEEDEYSFCNVWLKKDLNEKDYLVISE